MKKRLTIGETAFELGVSERHIYGLLRQGKLKAVTISASGKIVPQSIRIEGASVELFLESRTITPESFPDFFSEETFSEQ